VLLSPMILQELMKEKGSDLRIDQYLTKFRKSRIDTSDEWILVNINSINEYKTAGFK